MEQNIKVLGQIS